MTRAHNSRLINVSLGSLASQRYKGLGKNKISSRIEASAVREMREVLKSFLTDAMIDARAAGGPSRTGKGFEAAIAGARAFGVKFSQLRGHIIAPSYMSAHNTGATIYPKNSDWLAVPLPAAQRADGSPKLPGPRSWKLHGSFIWKSPKTGKHFIVRRPVGSTSLDFLYVLVPSVTPSQKHKGWADKAWSKKIPLLISAWDSIVASYMSPSMVGEAYNAGIKRSR